MVNTTFMVYLPVNKYNFCDRSLIFGFGVLGCERQPNAMLYQ